MEISRSLEATLPEGYYAIPEQVAGGSSPDVLAFHERGRTDEAASSATMIRPKVRHQGAYDAGLYAKRKTVVGVSHVSDDEVVALIEVVSAGNKDSDRAMKQFVGKVKAVFGCRDSPTPDRPPCAGAWRSGGFACVDLRRSRAGVDRPRHRRPGLCGRLRMCRSCPLVSGAFSRG